MAGLIQQLTDITLTATPSVGSYLLSIDLDGILKYKTDLRIDQFLTLITSRIKDDEFLSSYLKDKFKKDTRDFKIKQII